MSEATLLGILPLVDATVEGHAAYLDSWPKVLRGDRNAIFTAARHAGEACAFILARAMPALDNEAAQTIKDAPR